jgi:hypothetical protein
LNGLAHEKDAKRKLFAQAYYSFAITAFRIDRIADSALDEKFPPKPNLEQYLGGHETLFLFMAYAGHIRDMWRAMENSLDAADEFAPSFQDFYDQRSHVIHGPQMPVGLDELSWRIPLIAQRNERSGEWHKQASWNDINLGQSEYAYAPDFIRQARDELFSMISKVHPKVFAATKRFFEGHQMVLPDKSALGISFSAGSASFKISVPPSGLSDGSGFMPFTVD